MCKIQKGFYKNSLYHILREFKADRLRVNAGSHILIFPKKHFDTPQGQYVFSVGIYYYHSQNFYNHELLYIEWPFNPLIPPPQLTPNPAMVAEEFLLLVFAASLMPQKVYQIVRLLGIASPFGSSLNRGENSILTTLRQGPILNLELQNGVQFQIMQ